jgi:hypothetical protein
MREAKGIALGVCLLGAMLQGCSLAEPAPREFIPIDSQRPAKAAEAGNTLAEAEAACKTEAEAKGKATLIGIFSRLRKGAADEDYVACMKQRGFEVKQ